MKRIYKLLERLTQRGLLSTERSSDVRDIASNLLRALVASGRIPSGNPRTLATGLVYLAFKQVNIEISIDQVASTINKPVESFAISVRSLRKRVGTSLMTA